MSCGAETTNGLALCEMCRHRATVDLTYLPVYFRNLARWRPGRGGSRQVPGSRVLYDGEKRGGDRVSNALDEVGADLVGWAEALDDDRPGFRWPLDLADVSENEQAASLCAVFAERLVSIATLEWAGEFTRQLGEHEARLRGLTETAVPGWYAGACKHCRLATFVVPGLTWVTCGGCGATTYARDHLETVLNEACDWVATPKRLAEAIVAMLDTEQSVPSLRKRIAVWGNRDKLEVHRPHDYAVKRYRLGDVLDLLAAKGATRPDLLPAGAGAC